MWEEIVLTEFHGEDCRGAGSYFEDQWPDNKNHLFSPMLFTWDEISQFFYK